MMRVAFSLVLALAAGPAMAQGKKHDGRGQMSQDERERMREDMRDAYRERQERPQKARPQQMSPEQRDKLRRDIQDANKDLKR